MASSVQAASVSPSPRTCSTTPTRWPPGPTTPFRPPSPPHPPACDAAPPAHAHERRHDSRLGADRVRPFPTDRPESSKGNAMPTPARILLAAVCHGLAGLLPLTLSDGSHLIAGKQVTG